MYDFFRRDDRELRHYDRICSCHFINGKPALFPWNEKKFFVTKLPAKLARIRKRYNFYFITITL